MWKLTRIGPTEAVFGPLTIRRDGADGLVIELTLKNKDGGTRLEVFRYRKRAL